VIVLFQIFGTGSVVEQSEGSLGCILSSVLIPFMTADHNFITDNHGNVAEQSSSNLDIAVNVSSNAAGENASKDSKSGHLSICNAEHTIYICIKCNLTNVTVFSRKLTFVNQNRQKSAEASLTGYVCNAQGFDNLGTESSQISWNENQFRSAANVNLANRTQQKQNTQQKNQQPESQLHALGPQMSPEEDECSQAERPAEKTNVNQLRNAANTNASNKVRKKHNAQWQNQQRHTLGNSLTEVAQISSGENELSHMDESPTDKLSENQLRCAGNMNTANDMQTEQNVQWQNQQPQSDESLIYFNENQVVNDENANAANHRRRKRNTQQKSKCSKSKLHIPPSDGQETFADMPECNNRQVTHGERRPFKCDACSKTFRLNKQLNQHSMQVHMKLRPHKCDLCSKAFRFPTHLAEHRRVHTGEKPHNCETCGMAFRTRGMLNYHIETHNIVNPKPRICDTCGKAFKNIKLLNAHKDTHTDLRPFSCHVCGKAFKFNYALTKHMVAHHTLLSATEDRHLLCICEFCGKGLTTPAKLRMHTTIHTGERPYKCSQCHKTYRHQHALKIHTNSHTGVKPYKCRICDKAFQAPVSLIWHTRIHTGAKPYKCQLCQKSFSQPGSLKDHVRIHTGEKPHKCPMCDMAFIASSALTVHIRRHTGEKPYKCHKCDAAFVVSSKLSRHMRVHACNKKESK